MAKRWTLNVDRLIDFSLLFPNPLIVNVTPIYHKDTTAPCCVKHILTKSVRAGGESRSVSETKVRFPSVLSDITGKKYQKYYTRHFSF